MHRRALLAVLGMPHLPALGHTSPARSNYASSPSAPASQAKQSRGASSGPPSGVNRPETVSPRNVLTFPLDHGAHPAARIEWWYLTGWLQSAGVAVASGYVPTPEFGFQLTFFRSRTGIRSCGCATGKWNAPTITRNRRLVPAFTVREPKGKKPIRALPSALISACAPPNHYCSKANLAIRAKGRAPARLATT